MGMKMNNLINLRKGLILYIPVLSMLSALSVWTYKNILLDTIVSLGNMGPVVRITPGSPAVVYFLFVAIALIVGLVSKAMPCRENIVRILERVFNISIYIGVFIALTCLIIFAPLQYYAMPKLGYVRCNILKDHPSIYFTDWVRNPSWCVRGKSREWVMEQAQIAEGQDF